MVEAVARGEVEAAAVSPATVGTFNLRHPDAPVRFVHAYDAEPELRWNLAVGMRRADAPLREAHRCRHRPARGRRHHRQDLRSLRHRIPFLPQPLSVLTVLGQLTRLRPRDCASPAGEPDALVVLLEDALARRSSSLALILAYFASVGLA